MEFGVSSFEFLGWRLGCGATKGLRGASTWAGAGVGFGFRVWRLELRGRGLEFRKAGLGVGSVGWRVSSLKVGG